MSVVLKRCEEVETSLKTSSDCFLDIPIAYGNNSVNAFMDPRTFVVRSTSIPIVCMDDALPVFKIRDQYYQMLPHLICGKCAPQFEDNQEEFAVIKRLWQKFLTSEYITNSEKVRDIIQIIVPQNLNNSRHGKQLNLVAKKFKLFNKSIKPDNEIYRPHTKKYINLRINYHYQTFSRHNRQFHHYLNIEYCKIF